MAEKISDLVRSALEKAIQQDGEVRLISKGASAPGIFPTGTSKAKTEAIDDCFSFTFLEKIREVEEGKGKSARKSVFVKITPAGIRALFESVPIERRQEILRLVSPSTVEVANDAFLKLSVTEMQELETALSSLLKKEGELIEMIQEIAAQRLTSFTQTKSSLEAAIEKIKEISTLASPFTLSPRQDMKFTGQKTEEDLDFQRDQCEQLVFAWKEADGTETKQALENVMYNLGLEAQGERGQILAFDGRRHETDDTIEAGSFVTVAEPGWQLSNSRGVYLISKTKVKRKDS